MGDFYLVSAALLLVALRLSNISKLQALFKKYATSTLKISTVRAF